ncbi:unnamed protein product [Rhizophagus irregularis]|nr:unnamed protein product [Rhizophagus irregularis]
MAEWTDTQIRILIDEHRNRNDEFHDLGRDRKSFWNSIAVKINWETGTAFNGYQCKEKFSNLVRDYNVSYHCIWRTMPGSGYITSIPSSRDVERELRSSERRLSRSSSISRSQSPPITRRQSPSVSRIQSLPVRERRSTILPVSSLTTNDEMDISDTGQLVGQRRTSTHEELSLSLHPPLSYDIATAQKSSNVRGNIQ